MHIGTFEVSNPGFLNSFSVEKIDQLRLSDRYRCDVLLWSNNHEFHSDMLRNFPNLKLFINWGHEDANLVDEENLRERVAVKKVNSYSQQSVSEYILMLIIAFERAQEKNFQDTAIDYPKELFGKTVGVVGLGRIGFQIARFMRDSLGCTILYNTSNDYHLSGYTFVSKEELFKTCDYVIIVAKARTCVLDTSLLERANPNLVIVNLSRDSVLPFVAIRPYVQTRRIRGYIGDVTERIGDERDPRIMFAPKIGYKTKEATRLKHNTALFYLKQYQLREAHKRSFVYVARHSETEWNVQKIYQGSSGSPLTRVGEEQARRTGIALTGKGITGIFTSPLERAQTTSRIIADVLRPAVPIVAVPSFKEIDFGIFQRKSQDKVQELFEDFFRERRTNPHYKLFVPYPAGESYYDVYLRILSDLMELLIAHDDFLIVGHETANRIIRGIILDKSPIAVVNLSQQKNNEISILELSSGDAEEMISV